MSQHGGDMLMHQVLPPAQGRPVVVVDDDAAIRDLLAVLLEAEGYPVISSANGPEALAAIQARQPSLVVMDLHMPVLDGYGLVRQLQAQGFDPPPILMTATAREADQVGAEIGAACAFAKPFSIAELLAAIEEVRIP